METVKDILNICNAAIFYDYKKHIYYRKIKSST